MSINPLEINLHSTYLQNIAMQIIDKRSTILNLTLDDDDIQHIENIISSQLCSLPTSVTLPIINRMIDYMIRLKIIENSLI